jgi:nucleoside-diphosphate-sugar epimerase
LTRVLVTGASGFIGRHLVSLLVEHGHEVHAAARSVGPPVAGVQWHSADLLQSGASSSLTEMVAADALVHLAWYAEPSLYRESWQNLAWTEASLSLLRAFAAAGGSRAVMVGSVFEYDWAAGVCAENTTLTQPTTLYGACKSALASIVTSAGPALGLSCAWARVFWLYGPHEPPGRLVSSVIGNLLAGRSVAVSAGARRDFLHVRDVAAGLAALLDADVEGPVNIGSGVPVSVGHVAKRIGSLLARDDLILVGERKASSGEPLVVVADVHRLTSEVGFRPSIDLETGLRETIDWWRATKATAPQ